MKILLTLSFLTIAFLLPAASPYTLEAPPGISSNEMTRGIVSGSGVTILTVIAPEATAGLLAFDGATKPAKPPAADTLPTPVPVVENAPTALHGLFTDTFLSLSTPDFSHGEKYGFGLGVGYQFNKTLSGSVRVAHAGLNLENNVVSTVGARLESRLPWQFLAPFAYVGSCFDLGPDEFRLQPGIGIELGASKLLKGLSVFAEGGPDVDLKGHSSWLFGAGIRLRF